MDIKSILKKMKVKFLKFWRSDNTKIALLRDIFIAIALVLLILTALWAYTGQLFGAPMVAIESGSMTHPDEPFGRFGTIDAGDMVLLVKVNSRSDIVTHGGDVAGASFDKNQDHFNYWDYGDVVIYRPYGRSDRDQIIHRAMCWIEYHEEYDRYSVKEYGIENESSVIIPELGLTKNCVITTVNGKTVREDYKPPHSGFITKGDNNRNCDQVHPELCNEPIKVEWISGRASCELPWIGTINLFFNDITKGTLGTSDSTVKNVEGDCITCLIILIAVLVSIPITLDIMDHFKEKKKEKQKIEEIQKKAREEIKKELEEENKGENNLF